jgi:hypothetical protein
MSGCTIGCLVLLAVAAGVVALLVVGGVVIFNRSLPGEAMDLPSVVLSPAESEAAGEQLERLDAGEEVALDPDQLTRLAHHMAAQRPGLDLAFRCSAVGEDSLHVEFSFNLVDTPFPGRYVHGAAVVSGYIDGRTEALDLQLQRIGKWELDEEQAQSAQVRRQLRDVVDQDPNLSDGYERIDSMRIEGGILYLKLRPRAEPEPPAAGAEPEPAGEATPLPAEEAPPPDTEPR